jgi:curved DNA-binding protein CbpA
VAEGRLIDYYGLLNLPPRADLVGIENAYARVSDDLAKQIEVDDSAKEALKRVNEAYAVLSKPELRREYDRAFFSEEIAAAEKEARAALRRRVIKERILVGALLLIVTGQAALLLYMTFDGISPGF